MINHAEKVDCGAIVREKFWHYFWQRTFSTESIVMPDPKPPPPADPSISYHLTSREIGRKAFSLDAITNCFISGSAFRFDIRLFYRIFSRPILNPEPPHHHWSVHQGLLGG